MRAHDRAAGRHHPPPRSRNSVGSDGAWKIKLVIQPAAQSPNINVNDLGFFACLKIRVCKEGSKRFDATGATMSATLHAYGIDISERT